MILLFLSSLVFSTNSFDLHPAIAGLNSEFLVERIHLKQVFGKDSKLLQTCLDTINGKSQSVFQQLQKIQKTYPVDKKLVFSQGYSKSSTYELFCCLCLLVVHPVAGNFFVLFDTNYEQNFKNKALSPSLLMLLSVLTENPAQALQEISKIVTDLPDEEKDAITMFGLFCTKCSQTFGRESLPVQYMEDAEEDEDDADAEAEAAEVARRLRIESKIIKHFQTLTVAQSDRAE